MRGLFSKTLVAASLVGLAACDMMPARQSAPVIAPTPPQVRPETPAAQPAPRSQPPSAESTALRTYYRRVENELLAQGLMRQDGGGIDTPFTADMLARNFEVIALTDEYARGRGLEASSGTLGPVRKWAQPVRISAEFGASVDAGQRATDMATLTRYAGRLARVTGHPVSMAQSGANFHVLFMGQDDQQTTLARVQALVPRIDSGTLSLIANLPRDIHCLVVAFPDGPGSNAYGQAIALIRAEHPDLLRRACIHEEVAQGFGLANDSPYARPSIFNDDEEFALLTTHDELLLKILYDPRLTPGMSAEATRPIVRSLASSLTGGPS